VILSEGQPRTVERLGAHGVEVVEIPYGEIQRGGGGIHCTTMELRRERA
jgi:arginine deiminase